MNDHVSLSLSSAGESKNSISCRPLDRVRPSSRTQKIDAKGTVNFLIFQIPSLSLDVSEQLDFNLSSSRTDHENFAILMHDVVSSSICLCNDNVLSPFARTHFRPDLNGRLSICTHLFVSARQVDRKSTRLNSSHSTLSRMPSSA